MHSGESLVRNNAYIRSSWSGQDTVNSTAPWGSSLLAQHNTIKPVGSTSNWYSSGLLALVEQHITPRKGSLWAGTVAGTNYTETARPPHR